MSTYDINIKAQDNASGVLKNIQTATDGLSKSFGTLETVLKAVVASETVKKLADISMQFEKMGQKMATVIPATVSISQSLTVMTAVANKLGTTTGDVVGAFTLLQKAGITPTEARFKQLAAIAAGTGETMADLADAIEEGVGGSFGKLQKRIDGLDIKQYGNTFVATLNGMKIAASSNAKDITEAVLKIGDSANYQRALLEQQKSLGAAIDRVNNGIGAAVKDSGIGPAFAQIVNEFDKVFVKSGLIESALRGLGSVASTIAENFRPIIFALGVMTSVAIIQGLITLVKGIELVGIAAAIASKRAGVIGLVALGIGILADKLGVMDKALELMGGGTDTTSKKIKELENSTSGLDAALKETTGSTGKLRAGVNQADEALKQWAATIDQAYGTSFSQVIYAMGAASTALEKFQKTGKLDDQMKLLNWFDALQASAEKVGVFFAEPLAVSFGKAFVALKKETAAAQNDLAGLTAQLDIFRNRQGDLVPTELNPAPVKTNAEGQLVINVVGGNDPYLKMLMMRGDAIDQLNLKQGRYYGSILTLEERVDGLKIKSQDLVRIEREQQQVLNELVVQYKAGAISGELYTRAIENLQLAFKPRVWEEVNKQATAAVNTFRMNKDEAAKLREEVQAGSMSWEKYGEMVKLIGSEHLPEASTQMNVLKSDVQVVADTMKTSMFAATESMSRDILKAVQSGQNAFGVFKNFLGKLFDDIVTQLIKKQLVDPLALALNGIINGAMASGGSGGLMTFIMSLFGGGRAAGGPVDSGTPYVIGERGPEIFVPNSAGTIIPNDHLTTSNGKMIQNNQPLNVNFTINAIDTQTGVGFLLQNKPAIINMVSDAYNRRGRNGPLN